MEKDYKKFVYEISKNIMRMRLQQGLTRKELATKTELTKSKIKKIERKGKIDLVDLFLIAQALNTKINIIVKVR